MVGVVCSPSRPGRYRPHRASSIPRSHPRASTAPRRAITRHAATGPVPHRRNVEAAVVAVDILVRVVAERLAATMRKETRVEIEAFLTECELEQSSPDILKDAITVAAPFLSATFTSTMPRFLGF